MKDTPDGSKYRRRPLRKVELDPQDFFNDAPRVCSILHQPQNATAISDGIDLAAINLDTVSVDPDLAPYDRYPIIDRHPRTTTEWLSGGRHVSSPSFSPRHLPLRVAAVGWQVGRVGTGVWGLRILLLMLYIAACKDSLDS